MNKRIAVALLTTSLGVQLEAAEVTIKNDSLNELGGASIVWGFVGGEKAASWLTSPCNGNLRAVQVFWRSPTGTTGEIIHSAIEIFRSATFPNPGLRAEQIVGPVLNDGVLNEYRYLDENSVIPLIVPVSANETVVVSFQFDFAPIQFNDPSITRDTNGIQSGRNAIYAQLSAGTFVWADAAALGVQGDWIIRAVIDCAAGPQEADVGVAMATNPAQYLAGQPLTYTIVIDNAGPAAAPMTTVVDILPATLTTPSWTCNGSGGGVCPLSGSGNITHNVMLSVGGSVTYTVVGTIAAGTSGTLSNTVTAVVGGAVSDPIQADNTVTINTVAGDVTQLFTNGFEN